MDHHRVQMEWAMIHGEPPRTASLVEADNQIVA
jgi:hypothetical protein